MPVSSDRSAVLPPASPRAALLTCLLTLLLLPTLARAYDSPSTPAPHPFNYPRDTYAFKNETVWNYGGGTVQSGPDATKTQRQYTRRCFVLSRSIVQFWKFARFDPAGKPLDDQALAARIRDVTERSVWLPILPEKDRIVFPGYHDLREASADRPDVFRENVGLGWPIYFRPGNFPITVPVDRWTEARVNREMFRDIQKNYPTIIWAYRFPSLKLNHVLVVYACTRDATTYHYLLYDPNYDDRPTHLDYDIKTRSFTFQPTYYFKGGSVNVRAIYRGLFE
jgi:hypothetical protein